MPITRWDGALGLFRWALGTICAVATVNCAAAGMTPTAEQPERVSTGRWGGNHAVLDVTADGARVEFDCAHGTLDEALVLSRDRRFVVKGTYTQERPGPERVDSPDVVRAARYEAEMANDVLTLTVVLSDPTETLGPFTLKRDAAGLLRKCR